MLESLNVSNGIGKNRVGKFEPKLKSKAGLSSKVDGLEVRK